MNLSSYAHDIEEHYSRVWSQPVEILQWKKGPIHELPDEFRILLIRRSDEMMAYATRCMSQPDDSEAIEIHVLCTPDNAAGSDLPEILTAVAHYHRTGARLALGHSVNFGKPWSSGSSCTHGVLSLPYLDGPKLEWLERPKVRFLWMIPVTPAECAFKRTYGMEALEQRFEMARFNFLDLLRSSVV